MRVYVRDLLPSIMLAYPLTIFLMGLLLFLTYFLVGKAKYLIYLSISFFAVSLGIAVQISQIPKNVPLNVTLSGLCFLVFSYFIAQGIVKLENKKLNPWMCVTFIVILLSIRYLSTFAPNIELFDFMRVLSVYAGLILFVSVALWKVRHLVCGGTLEKIWYFVLSLWVISLLVRLAYISYSPEILRILFLENKNPFYVHFVELQHTFYILLLVFSILTLLLAVKRLIKDISQRNLFDTLTEAYNRLGLQHFIEFELPKLKSFSLIMLDIDLFKSVNSRYGHPVGDAVIRKTVDLIHMNFSGVEHKVIRIGGEEFMIVLPDLDLEELQVQSEHLRARVEQHNFSDVAQDLHITVSMGIGEYAATQSFQYIYKEIDRKLALAKKNGRNRVVSNIFSELF